MQEDRTSRSLLESKLEAKKAEISDRLSLLRSEFTKNPVSEFARENPLVAVGAATLLGTAVGLLFRSRAGSKGAIDVDDLADRISERIEEQIDRGRPLTGAMPSREELRGLVRENIPEALDEIRNERSRPSLLSVLFGTIGRHLVMEGTAYLLGQLSGKLSRGEPSSGSE